MTQRRKTLSCLILALALCALSACNALPEPTAAVTEAPVAATPESTPVQTPKAEAAPASEAVPAANFKDTPYRESYTPSDVSFYENGRSFEFLTQTLDGADFDSKAEFAKAKVTMITTWTTTCGVCVREMPIWEKLSQDYAGSGFQIIGICCGAYDQADVAIERAQGIAAKAGTTYPQLTTSTEMFKGFISDIMYVPTTIFVDSEGFEICPSVIGGMGEQGWIDLIETIMHEQV